MDDVINAALRLLSYRPRSETEVRRRLSRLFSPPLVEDAIIVLRERGLLDDAAFARFWRQSREGHRPRGVSAMRWELFSMGVSREVVEEALEGLDEDEGAYRAACGMLRRLRQTEYDPFRKKLGAYLRRRGFGPETVSRTVRRVWQELSDPAYGHKEASNYNEHQKDDVDWRRE